MNQIADYEWCMMVALEEAEKAYRMGEVPVGAVILDEYGKVLHKTHNLKEAESDVTSHAEICALRYVGKEKNNWRLAGATLVVTLEPCPMCLSAIQQARVKKLVFGAYDSKGGALSLGFNLHRNSKLNHNIEVIGGIHQYKSSKLLSQFFKERRTAHSS
jgi:tRNA(adenine34) deaminase